MGKKSNKILRMNIKIKILKKHMFVNKEVKNNF